MITSISEFLKYFGGVNRRAVRDVGALPDAAEAWVPPTGSGEQSWTIGQLVAHMAASRMFFATAYCDRRWEAELWSAPTTSRAEWVAALNHSAELMTSRLSATPDDWLQRRIPAQEGAEQTLAGWRVLMLGVEHDIHHRSQIDTYAGIAGWEVQQIYGRRAEDVGLAPSLRAAQLWGEERSAPRPTRRALVRAGSTLPW